MQTEHLHTYATPKTLEINSWLNPNLYNKTIILYISISNKNLEKFPKYQHLLKSLAYLAVLMPILDM